MKKKHQSRPGY